MYGQKPIYKKYDCWLRFYLALWPYYGTYYQPYKGTVYLLKSGGVLNLCFLDSSCTSYVENEVSHENSYAEALELVAESPEFIDRHHWDNNVHIKFKSRE